MGEKPASLKGIVLTALISGAVVSTITGVLFTRYVTGVAEEVRSQRVWKERSVAELLGPMNIQFERTKRAFDRWKERNLYLEVKVIKAGNEAIRDLLLAKGHLIPLELVKDAGDLIVHYDVWLEIFEKQRGGREPDLLSEFTFAGPEGYPFPSEAEARFRGKYREYWNHLYAGS
jgi:hypothetical protein